MKIFLGKYKEYISIVIFIALLWGLFSFVILPAIEVINAKVNGIQEKIAEKEGSGRKLEKVTKMKEQYEVIKNEEGKVQDLLFYDQAIILIEAVEKLAAETGNKVEIRVEEKAGSAPAPKPKSGKKETSSSGDEILPGLPSDKYLKMNISTTGDLEGLVDFVRRLENIQYWSDIISLQISSQNPESAEPRKNPMSPEEDVENKTAQEKKADISSVLEVVFYLEK